MSLCDVYLLLQSNIKFRQVVCDFWPDSREAYLFAGESYLIADEITPSFFMMFTVYRLCCNLLVAGMGYNPKKYDFYQILGYY